MSKQKPVNPSAKQLGARIRFVREHSGRSQSDIARLAGISQNSIQKIENGKVSRSRHFTRVWQLVGLDTTELNPAFKPAHPPAMTGNGKLKAAAAKMVCPHCGETFTLVIVD